MFNYFINHKAKTVNRAAGILTVSAIASRFLGIVRDWLLAKSFGAGPELDIYFTAFKIPDFIYNILILGGILVAFLPLFSEYFSKNKEEAWKFVSNCLNVFMVLSGVLAIFLFFSIPFLMQFIAPGFNIDQVGKTIILTRIMLLSPILFSLSSVFSGVLQYFNRFLAYGLCPIVYNLGIIFGILFLAPSMGILGVVWGVILGALLHLLVQVPSALSCGLHYEKIIDFKDSKIKKIFSLMVPRMFGVSVQQINLIITNAIASTLVGGSISIFNFSNNIQYFPIGIIGIPFAVAAFPILSKDLVESRQKDFVNDFSITFNKIVYFVLPVITLVFVLRKQIIGILLRGGLFSDLSAQLTSSSLALFCVGILASSLIPLLFRAFFSLKDTKTPTLIAVFSMLINVGLSFLFTYQESFLHEFFRSIFSYNATIDVLVLGLPLAFSLAAIIQFLLMLFFLKSTLKELDLKRIFNYFFKILISSFAIVLVGSLLIPYIQLMFNQLFVVNVLQILSVTLIGSLAYLLMTFILKIPTTNLLFGRLFKNEKN